MFELSLLKCNPYDADVNFRSPVRLQACNVDVPLTDNVLADTPLQYTVYDVIEILPNTSILPTADNTLSRVMSSQVMSSQLRSYALICTSAATLRYDADAVLRIVVAYTFVELRTTNPETVVAAPTKVRSPVSVTACKDEPTVTERELTNASPVTCAFPPA